MLLLMCLLFRASLVVRETFFATRWSDRGRQAYIAKAIRDPQKAVHILTDDPVYKAKFLAEYHVYHDA